MAGREANIDWNDLERAYREGQRSVNSLARDFGVSEAAVRKRARRRRWVRDEAGTARRAAYAEADRRAKTPPTYVQTPPERILELAEEGADVLIRHRRDAGRLRLLLRDLLKELTALQEGRHDLEAWLTEARLCHGHRYPQSAAAYCATIEQAQSAMTIAGRVKILLTIVNAFNKLVDIERKAWNLDEVDDTRSYEDVLAEVYGKALNDRTVATHTAKLISNSQRDD